MKPLSYLYRELILGLLTSIDGDSTLDEDEEMFAIELKAKSANLINPLNFDEKQCEDTYRSIRTSQLSGYLNDLESELREGKVKTGLVPECGGYAESEAVAIPVSGIPDLCIGWTYFFGGCKHSNPESIEWMENCYLVRARDRVQTIRFFEREVSLDRSTLWDDSNNPE